ncbi:ParM/StbA family protein [Gloeothece verrucosa]|uniref:Actin-like protein N-terminal domain-containing protein n=1 Tax=Gloeothece verrucosa (strain PCC 7822) TaxID=497965 RepID=E0UMA8_GLOV7|nr:ParM/StbA family protein [Gloeothece verrucosa]ADN18088.1 hypothetical protein Cyan7822_6288 [Gloeothece verrucosa PCC 7822]
MLKNKICIDLGSSEIKTIYQLGNNHPTAITLLPNIGQISESRLNHHRSLNQTLKLSEDISWITTTKKASTAIATDSLAYEFYEITNLNKLKTDEGCYRIAATIGKMFLLEGVTPYENFPLSITLLLPYNEFKKEKIQAFKIVLKKILKKYYYRDNKITIEPKEIKVYPEGLGILTLRNQSSQLENGKKTIIIMIGHRNTSYLIFEGIKYESGKTINLGFHSFLEMFCKKSVGQEENRETVLALWKARENPNYLTKIVKSQIQENRENELAVLTKNFHNLRKELWSNINEWLKKELNNFEYHELLFAGGTSEFLQPYINEEFKMKTIKPRLMTKSLAQDIEKFLILKTEKKEDLLMRLADCYGLFQEVYN